MTQADINQQMLGVRHQADGLGRRTVSGAAYAIGAQLVRLALQVASVAALSRMLAPEEFGIIAVAAALMAFLTTLTELNMSAAVIQRQDLDQNTASALLAIGMGMALVTVVLSLLATPLAAAAFHDQRLGPVLVGLAATAPLNAAGGHQYALLARNMRWAEIQGATLAGLVAGIAAAILSAWLLHVGYWALVIQAWVSSTVTTAAYWMLCPWRPSIVRDWTSAAESIRFGANLTLSMLLNYVHRQADNLLIGWRWGAAELGQYARAYSLMMTPLTFLSGPLWTALIPALSRIQGEPEKWRNAYLDALAVVTFVGAAMSCILYGAASPLIDLVLGPGWQRAEAIFAFLAVGMLVSTPMDTTGWIYVSLGRTNRMLRWALVGAPLYLLAFVVGLPFGGAGVALCYAVSRYIAFIPCFWFATRGSPVALADVLQVIAAPLLIALPIGIGLQQATLRLPSLLDWAAIFIALVTYGALAGVAIWRLQGYRRLRERARQEITRVLAGLAPDHARTEQ